MLMTPTEHNDGKWLVVRRETGRGNRNAFGWYVVRVCPCHFGHQVTVLPYETEERAELGRRIILGIEGAAGERHAWVEQVKPTAVLAGQIWRRNRLRGNRFLQVVSAHHGKAAVRTVVQTAEGGWVRLQANSAISYIAVSRMLSPTLGASHYTLVEEEVS